MGTAQLRLDKPCIQFMCTVLYRNLHMPHRRTRKRFNLFRSKVQKQQRAPHPRTIIQGATQSSTSANNKVANSAAASKPVPPHSCLNGTYPDATGSTHLILLHKFDLSHSPINCRRYISRVRNSVRGLGRYSQIVFSIANTFHGCAPKRGAYGGFDVNSSLPITLQLYSNHYDKHPK